MADCIDCRPGCCKPGQNALHTTFGSCPLTCETCCDTQRMSFAIAAGDVIGPRTVVYFTGNDVEVDFDGTVITVAEVTVTPGAGTDVAGISQWGIDNTAGDAGAVAFLVHAKVYSCGLALNGAKVSDLRKVGLFVENIVQ